MKHKHINSLKLTRHKLNTGLNNTLCLDTSKLFTHHKKNKKQTTSSTSNTANTIFTDYSNYVNTISTNFTSKCKHTLDTIFNVKNTLQDTNSFELTYNIIDLQHNLQYKIPDFLNIIKYLTHNNSNFTVHFTNDEISELKGLLKTQAHDDDNDDNDNNDNNDSITREDKSRIYMYLETHKIGNKLSKVFYNFIHNSNNLDSNILKKYESLSSYRLIINDFTSYKVIEHLENDIDSLVIFSVKYKEHTYSNCIYLYFNKNSISSNPSNIRKYGLNIVQRILFFNAFLGVHNIPEKFILFLTDLKKEVDDNISKHFHFKTNNVNSAVTNKVDIIIYRKQELLKSIFHELIHFHSLDSQSIPKDIMQNLLQTHNISASNTYLLYECMTEVLANTLNNIFLSTNINQFKQHMIYELQFSTFQVSKILNILQYGSFHEFTNTKNPKKHFKQDSCVFSYYILKTYLLHNLDSYFKQCLDDKLKFKDTHSTFNTLLDIFNKAMKDPILSNTITQLIQINKNKGKQSGKQSGKQTGKQTNTKNTNLYKTLRMTCLDTTIFSPNT